jgi:hypothetical protein
MVEGLDIGFLPLEVNVLTRQRVIRDMRLTRERLAG